MNIYYKKIGGAYGNSPCSYNADDCIKQEGYDGYGGYGGCIEQ